MSEVTLSEAKQRGLLIVLSAALAITTILAVIAWAAYLKTATLDQPLSVVACTPETYDPGLPDPDNRNRWLPGSLQSECVRVHVGQNSTHPTSKPIPVAGQVCNAGDRSVPYRVTVSWQRVDPGPGPARLTVIDVPITYVRGCEEPYVFNFEVPDQILAISSEPGDSLGRWRIVGRAEPVERGLYEVYQWDGTGSFELIVG